MKDTEWHAGCFNTCVRCRCGRCFSRSNRESINETRGGCITSTLSARGTRATSFSLSGGCILDLNRTAMCVNSSWVKTVSAKSCLSLLKTCSSRSWNLRWKNCLHEAAICLALTCQAIVRLMIAIIRQCIMYDTQMRLCDGLLWVRSCQCHIGSIVSLWHLVVQAKINTCKDLTDKRVLLTLARWITLYLWEVPVHWLLCACYFFCEASGIIWHNGALPVR